MTNQHPDTIDELTIDTVLSVNIPIHPEHEIDKRNIKAALSAMVAEIIGKDFPIDSDAVENVAERKAEQRQRAIKKGFTL